MKADTTNSDLVSGEVNTRLTKDSDKQATVLTLDFAGATREQLIGLATSTLVIDWQAVQRTAGSIPAKDTVLVTEFLNRPRQAGGFKATPENMAARINKMPREEYVQTLLNMGLDEKAAERLAKQKFDTK